MSDTGRERLHDQLEEGMPTPPGPSSPIQPGDRPQQKSVQREKKLFLLRACMAEMLCTFIFLFSVMAMSVNSKKLAMPPTTVESAIVTGFTAVAMVYSFGDVSGAHFNPAVTFATMIIGKTTWKKGALYVVAQLFASVLASFWIGVLYGFDDVAGLIVDPGQDFSIWQAFLMETTLTFILCYVIFATAFGESATTQEQHIAASHGHKGYTIYTISPNSKSGFAGIAIGFTLGFLTMIGGSVSGGAFNPARAFGPAICTWRIFDGPTMWLYWVGDLAGAAAAGVVQRLFNTINFCETEGMSCRALALGCLPVFITRRFS